jgi:hypothetical protein
VPVLQPLPAGVAVKGFLLLIYVLGWLGAAGAIEHSSFVLNCKERGDAGCDWKAAGLALFWPVAYVISRVNEQLTEPKP